MPFDNTPTEITVDTPASLLIEAGMKLIERPEHWCRLTDEMFLPCGGKAYCAWGATRAASDGEGTPEFLHAQAALDAVAKAHGYADTGALNDDPRTTHAMVLQVMREAIAIARSKSNV